MQYLKKNTHILFILPGLVLYTTIVIYTILSAFPYSLTKWSGIGDKEFVGLDNYKMLFTDQRLSTTFFMSLKNSVVLAIISIFIVIPLVLLIAYLIYRKIPAHSVIRTLIFTPYLVNFITMGFLVTLFMDPNFGLLAKIVNFLGINWSTSLIFAGSNYGIPYIATVNAWKGMGYYMMIFIANFALVPAELEEAAIIDGAGE